MAEPKYKCPICGQSLDYLIDSTEDVETETMNLKFINGYVICESCDAEILYDRKGVIGER